MNNQFNLMDFKEYNWLKDIPKKRAPSILVDGVSGSGKSYLVQKIIPILDQTYKYKKKIIISSTSKLSGDFKQIPKNNHYDATKMNIVLENLIKVQTDFLKKRQKNNVLVILDDVIGTTGSNIRYNKLLERAFTNFRHLNISIIMLLQDIGGKTAPTIRLNSTQIIMFKNNNYNKKKYIVENFLSLDNNKKKGYEILNNIWNEPFKALVINQWNIQRSEKLSDYIFYYIA